MNRGVQTGIYLAEPKWTVFANDSRQGLQQTEGVLLPVTCTDITATYLPVDVIDSQSFFSVNRFHLSSSRLSTDRMFFRMKKHLCGRGYSFSEVVTMLVKSNPAVKRKHNKTKECILKLLMLEVDAPVVFTVNVNNKLSE